MTRPTIPRLRRRRGAASEQLAVGYLQKRGLKLLERNFSCRQGEIDLVMQDQACIVFVEVRSRHTAKHVAPLESISVDKQRRIINTARVYLMNRGLYDRVDCRFDCIGIAGSGKATEIIWIPDAFPGV